MVNLSIEENLTYKEVQDEIFDHQVKRLRNDEITSTKVLSRNLQVETTIWEAKIEMMK